MNSKKLKFFHARPLFYGFLALLLGISTSRYVLGGDIKYIIFVGLIFLAFLVFCLWSKAFKTLIILSCALMLGFGWFFVGEETFQGKVFEGTCQIVGRISDDISYSVYGDSANVVLKDVYINNEKEKNISLTIYIDDQSDFSVGDIIAFEGEVEKVSLFTLGNFNNYYYRDGTAYTSSVDASNFVIQGNSIKVDEQFRLKVKEMLYSNMGEENGAVAFAVLFGDKTEVDDDIYQSYKTAGIIHVLTASGLNVSFLIGLLGFILKKCHVRRIYNLIICVLCLGMYVWLCGFAPSIVRAGIMGIVLLTTKISGKCYDNLNSLGLSGIIILIFSPLSALDLGFLMSFFCVLGIFTISPLVAKYLNKILPKIVADSFAISLGASVGILPFVASIYATFNWLTLFVNLIVIPIFAIIYPILFVGIFLVLVLPFLGFIFTACGWGLSFVYYVAEFFGETVLISNLQPFDIFFVGLLFVFIFLISQYFMANKKVKVFCCSGIVIISALLGVFYYLPVNNLKTSVAYGYNYSTPIVVLTNNEGKSVIVDVGYSSYTKNVLRALNVKEISTAFVLQKSSVYIQTSREIGVVNLIRADGGQGYDEEILIDYDQFGSVDGFDFVYRSYQNRLIGLEFSFDELKIFILRDLNQSSEALSFISQENYDIVILGKHDQYAESFDNSKIMTYYKNSLATSSFVDNGNMICQIKGKNFEWRCLD